MCLEHLQRTKTFLQCLGVTVSERSSRYGKKPLRDIPWAPPVSSLPFVEQCLSLNRFLLDGEVPGGPPCTLKKTFCYQQFPYQPRLGRSKRTCVTIVINFAISLCENQYFIDGNHRTAILLIYLLLHRHGLICQANEVHIYALISLAREEVKEERGKFGFCSWRELLQKYVCKKTTAVNVFKDPTTKLFADKVKTLNYWNTLFEDLMHFDTSDFKVLHQIKIRDPKLYQDYLLLRQRKTV